MISTSKGTGASALVPGPRLTRPLGWPARIALALIALVSLGLLAPVPAIVVAYRRRRAADWAAVAAFSTTWLLWIVTLSVWPDGGSGAAFALSAVLLLVNSAGAALHCLLAGGHAA